MSYPAWILLFVGNCLFCLWVLRWGGAEWMQGWRSVFILDWIFALTWDTEQIKFYVLLCWVGHAIWFLAGLFIPELGFHG